MDLLREQWKWLLVAALATGGWIARAEVSHFRADETTVRMAGIEEAVESLHRIEADRNARADERAKAKKARRDREEALCLRGYLAREECLRQGHKWMPPKEDG